MKKALWNNLKNWLIKMTDEFKALLSSSGKTTTSDDWDAVYEELPVVIALSTNELQAALDKLDSVGGYGYIATWRKNLFAFNPKLLSKRCGLIDENGSLLKAARIPKK